MKLAGHAAPVCALLVLALSAPPAWGRAVTWSRHGAWPGWHTTLGPTGARGWREGARIHVAAVDPASPAHGLLAPGDAIVGANGRAFEEGEDPRVALGNAITESETAHGGGRLRLAIVRDGERMAVVVPLRVLGSYSPTWPFECQKSARILERACRHLASVQYPDGHVEGELGMATMWAGLLWLASGEAQFLDNTRRAAYWLCGQNYAGVSLNSWPAGYCGVFLAEYYLGTGDPAVLPQLKRLNDILALGQMKCASWGHSSPWGGYGAVNQVGLACFVAMVLARECGVEVNERAIEASRAFFRKYAGKGWIPYGDHVPWRGRSGNGKNALAAVVFSLLPGEDATVSAFGQSVAASYGYREEGHTGAYFSFFWGPLGAALAGEKDLRTFLDHQRWYYDLARTWRGGLVCQPNPENLSGRTPGTYTWCGPQYTTAGMALFYALPRRTLRILGAPPSVFGRDVPEPVARARGLYQRRDWKGLGAAIAALSEAHRRYGEQLATAASRLRESVALTLKAFENDIAEDDPYRASERLKSLERLLGPDEPQLAEAEELMGKNERWVEEGRKYYEAFSALRDFTWQYWYPYGVKAMGVLEHVRPPAPKVWRPLAPTSERAPQSWRALQLGASAQGEEAPSEPKEWEKPSFDDKSWAEMNAPLGPARRKGKGWSAPRILLRRSFTVPRSELAALRLRLLAGRDQETEVYLNGVLVARALGGGRRGYARIALDRSALRLLRRGGNLLAVRAAAGQKGRRTLDLGLEGWVKE